MLLTEIYNIDETFHCDLTSEQDLDYAVTVTDTFGFSKTSEFRNSNEDFAPLPVDMISVEYIGYELNMEWEETQDLDFSEYVIFYCEDPDGNYTCGSSNEIAIDNISSPSITQSVIIVDPQELHAPLPTQTNLFWIETRDAGGQTSSGAKILSERDGAPMQVDVLSVDYNAEFLTVQWNIDTVDNDFKQYIIYRSNDEYADVDHEKIEIDRLTDKYQSSYNVIDFDPSIESWYWVGVEDLWGQVSIGSGMANLIDLPSPYRSITGFEYSKNDSSHIGALDYFTVFWETLDSTVQDFQSYKILRSIDIDAVYDTSLNNLDTIGIILDREIDSLEFLWEHPGDEVYWYWLESEDYWGLKTLSDPYKFMEEAPEKPLITNIYFTTEENVSYYVLSWAENTEFDFLHYKIFYSHNNYEEGDLDDILFVDPPIDSSHITEYYFEIDSDNQIYFFQIMTEDVWGKTSYSGEPEKAVPYDQVVFHSDRDGEFNIYRVQLDFDNDEFLIDRVADLNGNDFNPVFSPWGSKIAFYSRQDMNYEIYKLNANGYGLENITNHSGNDYNPQFTSDGSRIIFESTRTGNLQLYSLPVNEDGSNLTQLTSNYGSNSDLNVSSGKIVYTSSVQGNSDVWIMNENGSNKINCTGFMSDEYDPDINSDGSEIIYLQSGIVDSTTGAIQIDLFWINFLTGDTLQLTNDSYVEANPRFLPNEFSPDGQIGKFIIYESDRDGTSSLWIQELPDITDDIEEFPKDIIDLYALNSSNQKNMNVTKIVIDNLEVYRMVYESDEDGSSSIFIVDEFGNKMTLTDNQGNDYFPKIQP